MGKYRNFVNPAGVLMALHLNHGLRCVSKDLFIPKKDEDILEDKTFDEKMDEILGEFEKDF